MFKVKKAQIGETLTWIIATIVIIVILVFAIFVASSMGKNKEFTIKNKESTIIGSKDLLAEKSLVGYLLTQDTNKVIVYNKLKDEQDLNDFNGNLALKIFKEFYEKDYGFAGSGVWLGVGSAGFQIRKNKFFGSGPLFLSEGAGYKVQPSVSEKIPLGENKYLELILVEK